MKVVRQLTGVGCQVYLKVKCIVLVSVETISQFS